MIDIKTDIECILNMCGKNIKIFGYILQYEGNKIVKDSKISSGVGFYVQKNDAVTNFNVTDADHWRDLVENCYEMWLVVDDRLRGIDKVIVEDKEFRVISGFYDINLNSWHLILREV